MKKVFVTGNVGRDPETRYAPSGESFITFSFAVTTGSKDKQKTDWLEISCNGKTAELAQQYVRKGTKLLIEGTPSANAYINKEGIPVATLRIAASNIEFIVSKPSNDSGPEHDIGAPHYDKTQVVEQAAPIFNAPGPGLNADDVPF